MFGNSKTPKYVNLNRMLIKIGWLPIKSKAFLNVYSKFITDSYSKDPIKENIYS